MTRFGNTLLDKLIFMIASFGIGMAGGMVVLIVRSFT